jgi:hypothetical protein
LFVEFWISFFEFLERAGGTDERRLRLRHFSEAENSTPTEMVLIPSVRTDVSDDTLRQLVILGDAYLNLSSDEASCGPTEAIKVGI